jgi:ferricrocin synthase
MMAVQEAYWKSVFPMGWRPTFLCSNLHKKQGLRTNCVMREVVKSLKALQVNAQIADLNLHTILLACWAKLQARLCCSSEATFGLWHSGRSGVVSSDNLALPCLNFLPIRVEGADQNTLDSARSVSKDLQRRSGIVEKSRISDVSAWTGHPGEPLCNVYVNLLCLPLVADNGGRNRLKKAGRTFEPVNVS